MEELDHFHRRVATVAEGECGEVGSIHAQRVCEERSSPIAATEAAYELVHAMQLLHTKVTQETERLDDEVHIRDALAIVEMNASVREPVGFSHHVLQLSVGHAQESDIADAESAGLHDGHLLSVRTGMDRPVFPWVTHAAEVVHWFHSRDDHAARSWGWTLVDEPAGHSGAGQVLPSCHQVHLASGMFHASSDILDRKGSIS
mmetsp:Transcript_16784/g.36086  ORF Transcript_16784/g.36086 Transcript_16784/m.36086 type:complete len:202 (+) Transcript_16784:1054-1659(+)